MRLENRSCGLVGVCVRRAMGVAAVVLGSRGIACHGVSLAHKPDATPETLIRRLRWVLL
jgi:hypothetical protein